MSSLVRKYGFAEMLPNTKNRVELDGFTSRGELRAAAQRFAKKHGYTVQIDRGEQSGVLYLKFIQPKESMLLRQ